VNVRQPRGVGQGTEDTPPDLLTLAAAPLAGRISALETVWGEPDSEGPLPPRTVQISGLIVAEAIRLIRLGTTVELADSSLEVARLLSRREARSLPGRHPEAHRLLSGAAVALAAASGPSSPGGGMTVLQSWSGKAEEAVMLLNRSQGHALARGELRRLLGEPAESHLSHMLADLEAAGLIVRIRDGRTVTVHLGPAARTKEVQGRISERPRTTWGDFGLERELSSTKARLAKAYLLHARQHLTVEQEDLRVWVSATEPLSLRISDSLSKVAKSFISERALPSPTESYSNFAPDLHSYDLAGSFLGGLREPEPES
jgi:hypothetical protein